MIALSTIGISLTAPTYISYVVTLFLGIYFWIPRNEPKSETVTNKVQYPTILKRELQVNFTRKL